jgi:hypothetical protein
MAVSVSILVFSAVKSMLRKLSVGQIAFIVLGVVLPTGFILYTGWRLDFRVLGRHLAPLLSLAVFSLAIGIAQLSFRRSHLTIVAVFIVLSVCSSLNLRFHSRHFKDDYRSAASMASEAIKDGQQVWWNANQEGAEYYGVPLHMEPSSETFEVLDPGGFELGKARLVRSPGELNSELSKPHLVVASRSDVFDAEGTLARYLKQNKFQQLATFPGFEVWKLPDAVTLELVESPK